MAKKSSVAAAPKKAARAERKASPSLGARVSSLNDLMDKKGIRTVDLKFADLLGTWQHFSITRSEFDENLFINGCGFDGSSIRGFQTIDESDMLVVPDIETAIVDPICQVPTLSVICDIRDPITGEDYSRDPRNIAHKAQAYLKKTGIADTAFFGPEQEFFIFDSVRYDQNAHEGYYAVDVEPAIWNSGKSSNGAPNLGFRAKHKRGYFPVPPTDWLQDIRSTIVNKMEDAGVAIEVHHAEVATGGQCEIDMRFQPLLKMADNSMLYRYIVRNVARQFGKSATFMPKPIFDDNGSGMHVHSSLWKNGQTLFFDKNGYAYISKLLRHYIGGLLKHAPALMAFAAPTTNSYRRLVPGFEAPVNLAFSKRNRSAACRIPMYSTNPKAKRVEFRPPDPMANPYLCFSSILLAGLDGIQNQIDPGEPLDVDIYELPADQAKKIKQVPGSLAEAINALEQDHDFLLQGDVFTQDLIDTWIAYKRKEEIDPLRLRPHPYEFFLYYDP